MLHRACEGVAGIGAAGLVAFLVAALTTHGNTDSSVLWIGAGICAVFMLGGAIGWLLTRDDHTGVSVKADAKDHSNALAAGRDLKIRDYYAAPAGAPKSRVSPNVVFDGFSPVREQQIQWARQTIDKPTLAEFVRLLFVNEVDEPTPEAGVPNLHAVIEIGEILRVADGSWADNPDRGTAPSRDVKSINLPSTGETRVLDIAMRPYGYNECFGWDHNGYMISEPSIPTGVHRVAVELTGANMKRALFDFILDNPLGRDARGVIEDSYMELIEPLGSGNACSARRARERRPELIGKLQDFIPYGNRLLEMYGRPDIRLGQNGLAEIGRWLGLAEHALQLRCPEYLADFRNDGVNIYKADVVSVDLLDRRLARLVQIIKEIRLR